MTRLPLLLAAALALGGCNARTATVSAPAARYASLDAALAAPGEPPRARRAMPVAQMPAWIGRPVGLSERDEAGAFEQTVSLSLTAKGESRPNAITVAMAPSDGSGAAMGKPTEGGIRAELEAAFPGIAMRVVERPSANAYGPYGLAIGRGAAGGRSASTPGSGSSRRPPSRPAAPEARSRCGSASAAPTSPWRRWRRR